MASSVTEEIARRSIFFVCLQALCENAGLVVKVNGAGKVISQSIMAGSPIAKGQVVNLDLKLTN